MATGHIEVLKRGFRAVVYAGKDPLTGRKSYLRETHLTHRSATSSPRRAPLVTASQRKTASSSSAVPPLRPGGPSEPAVDAYGALPRPSERASGPPPRQGP